MKDVVADKFLFLAIGALALCCVHPAIGSLVQAPLIIMLVARCDVKSLPALLVLMLGKGNIALFGNPQLVVLKLGITLKPENLFVISTFFFAVIRLVQNKYDGPSTHFGFLWLLSLIPASVMSFTAKEYGLSGIWSGPIMDSLAPSVYFWGISMASSYHDGKYYFASRMAYLMLAWNILVTLRIVNGFSFLPIPMSLCLCVYVYGDPNLRRVRPLCMLGAISGLASFAFSRSIRVSAVAQELGKDVSEADKKVGGTFSTMATVGLSIVLMLGLRRRLSKVLTRFIPVIMTVLNIMLVAFVISTQSGNESKEVVQDYQTMEERFNWKLFGDRAAVWMMGWEEVKTPPYFIKDLRQFLVVNPVTGQTRMKLLPHNQFLTLLGREGLWLGLTLSIFIVLIQLRMFRCYTMMPEDRMLSRVFLPVSSAIFFACGTAGQSVAASDLWGNSLATIVMPGIVYGQWLIQKKQPMFSYFNRGEHHAYPMA